MLSLALSLLLAGEVNAAVRQYNWTVGWTTINPDGRKDRLAVAINDQWPLPIIRAKKGDRLEIWVDNQMNDPPRNNSIHFHGLFQNGTNDMDGPSWVTQCPVPPGSSFLYNFTVDQPGTYWYHTHTDALYPDGYRQLILVEDDDAWFAEEVDREISFTLTDWYHELTQTIVENDFMNLYNPSGAEPRPNANLFNDTFNPKWEVRPNETVRLRLANTAAMSHYYFYIEDGEFDIVEVDGVYTEPSRASSIFITPAQRYSLLFNTSGDPSKVYRMGMIVDSSMYDIIPPDTNLNATGFLWQGEKDKLEFPEITNEDIYEKGPVKVKSSREELSKDDVEWFDDMNLVPYDHEPILPPPDREVTLEVQLTNLRDGINYAFFNDITWTHAKVPSLFTALSAPDDDASLNETVYGVNTHSMVLDHMDVVQLVLNNNDDSRHPFHLHGHNFQCLLRGPDMGDDYTPYDPSSESNKEFPEIPMRRDTLHVEANSHFVIRWRADNPGAWLFHCHVDWHLTQGLAVEFIEAPVQLRQNYKVHPIPDVNLKTCKAANVSIVGNAAGNFGSDFFDLSGMNRQQPFLPGGFTAKGVVAMIFSIISAFMGMGFIVWYGLSDTKISEANAAEDVLCEDVDPDDVSAHLFNQEQEVPSQPDESQDH